MFGYIRTDRPELLVKEDELYKAVYCSLCRTIGRRYGITARLLLNYDATFIALFCAAINGIDLELYKNRCTVNKCKRCYMCRGSEKFENYAADITVITAYYKITDNIRDSTFFKALLYRLILLFIIHFHNKAKKFAPEIESAAKLYIERQSKTENEINIDPDMAAYPTALFGEFIFSNIPCFCNQPDELAYFGRCLGRYVYLIDAYDDLPDDKRNGCFNPYVNYPEERDSKIAEELYITAAMTADALNEIKLFKYKDIIENIICCGMFKRIDSIRTERRDGSISDTENKSGRHR